MPRRTTTPAASTQQENPEAVIEETTVKSASTQKKQKGVAHIKVKEISNPKYKRPPTHRFPIKYKDAIYQANGLTFGVTEASIAALKESTNSFYSITYKFWPAEQLKATGEKSTDYSAETLYELVTMMGSTGFKLFTAEDPRSEIKEIVEEFSEIDMTDVEEGE